MSDDKGMRLKLVILDQDRRILVDSAGGGPALPEVIIPPFTRIGYAATTAAREKYGLELFVITEVMTKPEDRDSLDIENLVLISRLQDANAALPVNLAWRVQLQAEIGEQDRIALEAAMKEFEPYDSAVKASSFGRYRSLDDLRAWYAPHLDRLGLRETGIQQWNGDTWFALFRIKTEPRNVATKAEPVTEGVAGPPKALWFKAVGEPNTREYAVTLALTQECPYWFAKIIASNPEWQGWLMEEVNGHELDEEPDGRPWALTARVLAKVQKRFVGKEDELLALGCRDWRMPRVLAALDPFFEDMEQIMERQPSEPPRRLDRSELRTLKAQCQDLCHRVEDVDIPYTITHGDFSPHNVLVSNGWPVFIDWAEAYVSFPFISWEYFWNRMIKDHPEHADWHERMHRNYAYRVWAPFLTKSRVDEGLRLSPAMAVLVLALYGIDDPKQRRNLRADKGKRSLVRRLHRELETLQNAEAEPVGAQ
jgi:Phosphotransferase enzyme family